MSKTTHASQLLIGISSPTYNVTSFCLCSVFRPVYAEEDEDKNKWARPPSSYGSMKSDSDDVDEYDEDDVELMEEQEQREERREEEECNEEVAEAFVSPPPEVHPPCPIIQRDVPVYEGTGYTK